jgi:hypothetical protein
LKEHEKETALKAKFEVKLAKERNKLERERQKLLGKDNSVEQPRIIVKKWREKDKRYLYDRIQERYVQMIRLRLNVIEVDPLRKIKQKQERLNKRKDNLQKAEDKKRNRKLLMKQREEAKAISRQQQIGLRSGLRQRESSIRK